MRRIVVIQWHNPSNMYVKNIIIRNSLRESTSLLKKARIGRCKIFISMYMKVVQNLLQTSGENHLRICQNPKVYIDSCFKRKEAYELRKVSKDHQFDAAKMQRISILVFKLYQKALNLAFFYIYLQLFLVLIKIDLT